MNPLSTSLPPENDPELRITALLLGELSEPEAEALRREIASSPELQTLLTQLTCTLGLLREARSNVAEQAGAPSEPLTLPADKRDRLLAAFKTIPLATPKKKTRIHIPWRDAAAVAAMLALLAGVTAVVLAPRYGSATILGKSMASSFGVDTLKREERGSLPQKPLETWEFRRSDKDQGFKQNGRKLAQLEDRLAEVKSDPVPPPMAPAFSAIQPNQSGFGGGLAGSAARELKEARGLDDFRESAKAVSDAPLRTTPQGAMQPLNRVARFGDRLAGEGKPSLLGGQSQGGTIVFGNEMPLPAGTVTATDVSAPSDAAGIQPLALQQAAGASGNQPPSSVDSSKPDSSRLRRLYAAPMPGIEATDKTKALDARSKAPATVVGQQPQKEQEAINPVSLSAQDRFTIQEGVAAPHESFELGYDKNRSWFEADLKAVKEESAAGGRRSIELRRVEQSVQGGTPLESDLKIRTPMPTPPVPQPEMPTTENVLSTFSLNVSDVSFKLAAASLEKGAMPDVSAIRSEEFINAFEYHDPEPAPGMPIAFFTERARYPFAHDRDLVRFSVKTAAAGRQPGKPFNIVLAIDNSGSMERADRVRILQECLSTLSTQLLPQDRISVVSFARTARLWIDGMPVGQAGNLAERIGRLNPEGGTNLEEAMSVAYKTALRHFIPGGVNRVVLITDGAANLGDVEPGSLKQRVEAHRKQGIALDCFGIGWDGLNDDLLEVLSRNGDGRYGFINTPEEAATEFAGQLAGALKIAASDVKVQVEWNPRRVLAYRQIGYAKHQLTKEQFRDNTVDAAEIAAAEAGNALYTVRLNPAGEGPLGIVRVRFRIPNTSDYLEKEWTVPYTPIAPALDQASTSLRLAGTAAAFSEWLSASPYAAEVTPDKLLGHLRGIPALRPTDPRPRQLETMIRQAKTISGK